MVRHKLVQLGAAIKSDTLTRAALNCGYKMESANNEFVVEGKFFRFIFHKKKNVTDVFYEKLRHGMNPNEEFSKLYRSYLEQYAIESHVR